MVHETMHRESEQMAGKDKESPLHERTGNALNESLAYSVLNALSANIAILDENGVILETNRAWRDYGRANGIETAPDMIGVNYLDLCDSAQGESADEAKAASVGIRAVMAGELEEFVMDYPCHSPQEKRWFYMRAIRIPGPGPHRVVVSHEDITPLKTVEEALMGREEELKLQAQSLEEANTALKVLLKHREENRRELEEKVVANVKELVYPYLDKMKKTRLDSQQSAYLEIVESHLGDIISPFLHRLSSKYSNLTPQEIRVASLVRDGKVTKEIADILSISTNAVDFHRKNIRSKLGLKNTEANLRSYLLSLS
jgi:DNA-binding CsgD family transcriptional regulator